MFHEVVGSQPEWVVTAGLGVAAFVAVACVFVAGARLFPDPPNRSRHVSGEEKRRREIRTYLGAVDQPFVEDHSLDGLQVDFYFPDHDVAVTFDPRTYYRLQRTPTTAVLVEHELPGSHLGARLPFDVPTLGGPVDDPTTAAFAVLGLPVEASLADVRAAYREKVKEAHPDHGGDRDEFRRVREAYTTAKEHAG
ncbi:J domain-containing protein [Halococcus salsus]|uniref:J domain-containing protein n=1 Tax=Halococcus salsus TaxID=2162894 RepID=UPI001358CCBC|nr:J domain-containing protein [Halococcus salsus]